MSPSSKEAKGTWSVVSVLGACTFVTTSSESKLKTATIIPLGIQSYHPIMGPLLFNPEINYYITGTTKIMELRLYADIITGYYVSNLPNRLCLNSVFNGDFSHQ